MKKILSIALCAAAVSVFGDTGTGTQLGNAIGVTEVTSSNKNTIVAVSYEDLDPSIQSGIAISNLVKTANLTVGDRLMIYVNGKYSTWTLQQEAGEGKPKYWAKTDITLTVNEDGSQTNGSGSEASDVICGVGTGIWLVRNNDYVPGEEFTFYIYGKPASTPTSEIVGRTWNLVGNPKQTEVNLGTNKVDKAKTGDQIVAIDADGHSVYYMFKAGKGWQATDVDGKAIKLQPIAAGHGLWIRTAENATILW